MRNFLLFKAFLAGNKSFVLFDRDGFNGKTLHRIDLFVLLDLIGAKDPTFVSLQSSTVVSDARGKDFKESSNDFF